jgi:hypothetical protein
VRGETGGRRRVSGNARRATSRRHLFRDVSTALVTF